MENRTVNCVEECANGCILGDACPHRVHLTAATKFIQDTSLDDLLAIAEENLRKKLAAPPKPFVSELPQWSEEI